MKKLLAVIAAVSLITPNVFVYSMGEKLKQTSPSVAKNIKRKWGCLTKPKVYGCSIDEQKSARKWLIYTPITVIVSVLALAGLSVGGKEGIKKTREAIRNLKIENIPSVIETTYTVLQQQYDKFKLQPLKEPLLSLHAQIKKSIDALQNQFEKLNITAFQLDEQSRGYLQKLFTMANNVADVVKAKFGVKLAG